MFYTDGVIEAGSRDIDDGIEWLRHAGPARGRRARLHRTRRVARPQEGARAATTTAPILLLERQPLTSPARASETSADSPASVGPRE